MAGGVERRNFLKMPAKKFVNNNGKIEWMN